MASIRFSSKQPDVPSVVDVGERPFSKRVTLAIGGRTENGLIALVNERRAILQERVPKGTPVVGPADNVEDALLDIVGGIGASGGSSWFYQNFSPHQHSIEGKGDDQGLTESTVLTFHHHNTHFCSTHIYVGWQTDTDRIQTRWHIKNSPRSYGFQSSMKPIPFMFAANNYDIVGEITGRSNELSEAIRRLPSPTTSEMFKGARLKYEKDMASAFFSETPLGVIVQHPPGVLFHVVHTGNEGQKAVERLG